MPTARTRGRAGPWPHGPLQAGGVMTVTDASVTWLTQEAYDRLKAELEELIDNRPVIAAEINARREEGDLKENGGYHAAREEQGQQEARIRQLQRSEERRVGKEWRCRCAARELANPREIS